MGRHEYRWFDGSDWTDQVASHGRQSVDPVGRQAPKAVAGAQGPDKIQRQVEKHQQQSERRGVTAGPAAFATDGSLVNRPIVVINQKMKLIEVNTEFALFGEDGSQIGAVRQVGQSNLKKVVRFFGDVDQFFTHKYQVVDANGAVQLMLTRPAKFMKSRIQVSDAAGQLIGQIVQQNVFGKIRFDFEVDGRSVGGIFAENWRAWNFSIKDASDNEVARVTKTFEGLLKTAFTTADNYVMQVHKPLDSPLRELVFAAAVSIDTALKQDKRGVSPTDLLDI